MWFSNFLKSHPNKKSMKIFFKLIGNFPLELRWFFSLKKLKFKASLLDKKNFGAIFPLKTASFASYLKYSNHSDKNFFLSPSNIKFWNEKKKIRKQTFFCFRLTSSIENFSFHFFQLILMKNTQSPQGGTISYQKKVQFKFWFLTIRKQIF